MPGDAAPVSGEVPELDRNGVWGIVDDAADSSARCSVSARLHSCRHSLDPVRVGEYAVPFRGRCCRRRTQRFGFADHRAADGLGLQESLN